MLHLSPLKHARRFLELSIVVEEYLELFLSHSRYISSKRSQCIDDDLNYSNHGLDDLVLFHGKHLIMKFHYSQFATSYLGPS